VTAFAATRKRLVGTAASFLLAFYTAFAQRLPTSPGLHRGQTLVYQLELSGSRSTRAESQVIAPQSAPGVGLNALCLLQVHVEEVTASGLRLKTYLSEKKTAGPTQSGAAENLSSPDKLVEVFISFNGSASQIKGFDQLSAPQQLAWSSWLSQFASPLTYPKPGVEKGRRWRASEGETADSPIAELSWRRKYEYVRQEACPLAEQSFPPSKSDKSLASRQMCAVILVQAQLRQGSPANRSTPPDFKLRGLSTRGTASGTNETVQYISTASGLIMRSIEDVQQSMDVTVALADGSNQVRYLINAKSRLQIQLLPDVPQDIR
jgi:hypothetical protein